MKCFNCNSELEKEKTWTVQLETAEGPHRVKLCEPCGKQFTDMRKWVAKNSDQDMNEMFRRIYDKASDMVTLQTQAGFIVTLADYMYKSGLVADQEINMVAFLTEVMIECEYV